VSFNHVWILHFLWALPLLVFFLVVSARKRRRDVSRLAAPHLIGRLMPVEGRTRQGVRNFLIVLAISLSVFALSGPQWGEKLQDVSRQGVDIIIAMDVSRSMLVSDVKPTRLEKARREVADLMKVATGDRMGLVAFAGSAFLLCPLTLDYGALDMFLSQINPDIIPVPGTDIGKAIDTATASFNKESGADKVIILVTDGEDNEGKGLEAAKRAAKAGVKIFVFGIGDPSGGPVPGGESGYQEDASGRMVLSHLNETGLSDIAQVTGGVYARAADGDLALDKVYFDGISQRTKKTTLKSGKITIREDRFYIFVLLSLILFFLEGVLREKPLDNDRFFDVPGGRGMGR
jgi:Ca-activated chloride channel family protein